MELKAIESAYILGLVEEEIAEEGLGNFIIKKMKEKGEKQNQQLKEKQQQKTKTAKPIPDEFWTKMEALLKKELKAVLRDPKIKQALNDKLDKFNKEYKDWGFDRPAKFSDLKFTVENDGDEYFIIDDSTQVLRHQVGYIVVDELVERIKPFMKNYSWIHVDTGDGDEGCIYFTSNATESAYILGLVDEEIATESASSKVDFKFFGKTYKVTINNHYGAKDANTDKLLDKVIVNSEAIAKKVSKQLIALHNDHAKEIGHPAVKSVDEIKGFKVKSLLITDDEDTVICITGEYDIDDHGWGIGISAKGSITNVAPLDYFL